MLDNRWMSDNGRTWDNGHMDVTHWKDMEQWSHGGQTKDRHGTMVTCYQTMDIHGTMATRRSDKGQTWDNGHMDVTQWTDMGQWQH